MSAHKVTRRELEREILRSVSRSFYLSIRLLPRQLREPITLAYLLARATDTIADTADVPADGRIEQLQTLAAAIRGDESAHAKIVDVIDAFAPLQRNDSERALIHALPACLDWLYFADDRDDIRTVLASITRGQLLDLERFGNSAEIVALNTADQLRQYTYLVAGCVGEFWTRLCFRKIDNLSELGEPEMLELGKQYGCGLQLVNILRDVGNDLRAGRCYFPAEEIGAAGLSPDRIFEAPEKFEPILARWQDEAHRGLEAGLKYSLALRNRRIRAATVLPALIGARTLHMLREARGNVLENIVKIPRAEVRGLISSVAITLADRQSLERQFRKLSGRGD